MYESLRVDMATAGYFSQVMPVNLGQLRSSSAKNDHLAVKWFFRGNSLEVDQDNRYCGGLERSCSAKDGSSRPEILLDGMLRLFDVV